jgi:hypothetical protein
MMGGSPAPAQSQGAGWIDKLLPVGVIVVIAYLIYQMLVGSGTGGATTTATTTPTTLTQTTPTTTTQNQPGATTLSQLIGTPTTKAAEATQKSQGGTIVTAPTNYGNVAVDVVLGGKGSAAGYYPIVGGAGLSISEPVTAQVAAQQITAIINAPQNEPYLGLQWGIIPVTTALGLGVVQGSQFAPGTKLCAGPGLGAPASDTWHYC